MCTPDENGDLIHEIISAMSSLNMYPDPIDGATGYLSETDGWCKHSMAHMHAACKIAGKQQQQLNALLSKLDYVLGYYHNIDLPLDAGPDRFMDALGRLIKKAREQRDAHPSGDSHEAD